MFTLRMIDDSGQYNWQLGDNYTYIGRWENPIRFRKLFRSTYDKDHVADDDPQSTEDTKNIMGFVVGDKLEVAAIYRGLKYYVMSSNGQTFANLTH